jgi:hypothetical protein
MININFEREIAEIERSLHPLLASITTSALALAASGENPTVESTKYAVLEGEFLALSARVKKLTEQVDRVQRQLDNEWRQSFGSPAYRGAIRGRFSKYQRDMARLRDIIKGTTDQLAERLGLKKGLPLHEQLEELEDLVRALFNKKKESFQAHVEVQPRLTSVSARGVGEASAYDYTVLLGLMIRFMIQTLRAKRTDSK